MTAKLRIVFLAAAFISSAASAYPQYIAKGEVNCVSCHHNPNGGGLATAYGHSEVEATFPDYVRVGWLEHFRSTIGKNEVTGYNENDEATLQYDLGADARFLFLQVPLEVADDPAWTVIPMLGEVGGTLLYGPVQAYATVTPRPSGIQRQQYQVASREHWLRAKLTDSQSLRVGRLVLPFGLRVPDHTAYTREDFGFNKWDQWYAAEWDMYTDAFTASAAVFTGVLIRERVSPGEGGLVASFAYNIGNAASIGVSGLAGLSTPTARVAGSLFARWRVFGQTYVMGEFAAQNVTSRVTNKTRLEPAALFRVGTFLFRSADLYAEFDGRTIQGFWETTKLRYIAGVDWKLLPWLELSPAFIAEETVETGLGATGVIQTHLFW
jgi:hypothetical protein